MKLLLIALSTVLIDCGLEAQISNDVLSSRSFTLRGPTASGIVVIESCQDAGQATIKLMSNFGVIDQAMILPLKHCTGGFQLKGSPWECLVAGMEYDSNGSNRRGVVAHVQLNAAGFSLIQSNSSTSVWPMSIGKAPGGLAIVDAKSRSILQAAYVPGGALPATWTTLASSADVPELATPGYISFMALMAQEDKVIVACNRGLVRYRVCRYVNGAQVWQAPLQKYGIPDDWTIAGNQPTQVFIPQGLSTVRVRQLDGTVLHQFAAAGNSWFTIPGIAEAVTSPGQQMEFFYPEAPERSFYVWPGVRYGLPLSIPELAIGNIICRSAIAVGGPQPSVAVSAARTAGSGGNVLCLLNLALRDASGADPVTLGLGPTGAQALLAPLSSLVVGADTSQVADNIGRVLQLTLTEQYAGTVLLSQFVLVGPNNAIGVSDVASMTVVSSSMASGNRAITGGSQASASRTSSDPTLESAIRGMAVSADRSRVEAAMAAAQRIMRRGH